MQTTWDLLPFSFPVRPKASDSPEPGDNILCHLPTILDTLGCWQKAAKLSKRYESMLSDTHLKLLFFPPVLFTTVTEKEQGFSGLDLNDTHERRQDRGMQNWVIGWLEIFRAVPALNYAVSRQLQSDLEGSTGDRSRCCSCPRYGCLSTCTRVTPWKGASIKKGGATQSRHIKGIVSHISLPLERQHWCMPDTVPPIQKLFWKLVLQSGRSWLMGDLLLPSGNGVLLTNRAPNLSGLANEDDASTEDALSTHHLLFQWGKGGSWQTLPPLGRNGSFFLIFPLNKNKTF